MQLEEESQDMLERQRLENSLLRKKRMLELSRSRSKSPQQPSVISKLKKPDSTDKLQPPTQVKLTNQADSFRAEYRNEKLPPPTLPQAPAEPSPPKQQDPYRAEYRMPEPQLPKTSSPAVIKHDKSERTLGRQEEMKIFDNNGAYNDVENVVSNASPPQDLQFAKKVSSINYQ